MPEKRTLERARRKARQGEPGRAASHQALSRQAHRVSERGRTTSQPVAKRRARSLKRETGGGKSGEQGAPVRAAQGQRKAIRGTRLRQRH
jgi:hypothetical protein